MRLLPGMFGIACWNTGLALDCAAAGATMASAANGARNASNRVTMTCPPTGVSISLLYKWEKSAAMRRLHHCQSSKKYQELSKMLYHRGHDPRSPDRHRPRRQIAAVGPDPRRHARRDPRGSARRRRPPAVVG